MPRTRSRSVYELVTLREQRRGPAGVTGLPNAKWFKAVMRAKNGHTITQWRCNCDPEEFVADLKKTMARLGGKWDRNTSIKVMRQ